jgi:hypothetical protein
VRPRCAARRVIIVAVDRRDDAEIDRAPICTWCGVTALPAESPSPDGLVFICENPDCDAFGEPV